MGGEGIEDAEGTGRVVDTGRGRDLQLARSLALPIDRAWAYLTDSARTDEWFGRWEGDARAGGDVRIRMRFETNHPVVRARIVACEAPERLEIRTHDEYGSWHLEARLEADGPEDTLLRFAHHLDAGADVGDVGPGWEYYLDLLVAATEGTEQPEFDQYYPALREYYRAQEPTPER